MLYAIYPVDYAVMAEKSGLLCDSRTGSVAEWLRRSATNSRG